MPIKTDTFGLFTILIYHYFIFTEDLSCTSCLNSDSSTVQIATPAKKINKGKEKRQR